MIDRDGFGLVECRAGEGVLSQTVDFAGHGLGGLKQGPDVGEIEQRHLATGDRQSMAEIVWKYGTFESCDVIADDDAPGKLWTEGKCQVFRQLPNLDW